MLISSYNSIANPVRQSALSTRGLKPSSGRVVYSVGGVVFDEDMRTLSSTGELTATIVGSTITFSEPQKNKDVCIGDKITLDTGDIALLNEKISLREWYVTDIHGDVFTEDVIDANVDSIDKVFLDINEALNNVVSASYLGTNDLVSMQTSLRLSMSGPAINDITASTFNYVTNKDYRLEIVAPFDVKTECNSNYWTWKHAQGSSTAVTVCDLLVSGIEINFQILVPDSDTNVTIERCVLANQHGPAITGPSTGNDTGEVKVYNCITSNYTSANPYIDNCNFMVANCTFTGGDVGVVFDDTSTNPLAMIVNSVFNQVTLPISAGALDPSKITGNLFDTGSLPTPENQLATVNISTYNPGQFDYTMWSNNLPVTATLVELPETKKDFFLRPTVEPCFGSHQYFKDVFKSVGTTDDVSSGGTCDILDLDSVATFTVAQNDPRLCAGYRLDTPAGLYVLKHRLSSNAWSISDVNGESSFTSEIGVAFTLKASDTSIDTALSTIAANLPVNNARVKIFCSEGSTSGAIDFHPSLVTSISNNIEILTADEETGIYSNCTLSRRHNGVSIDPDKHIVSGEIEIDKNFVTINGLQFSGSLSGINISDGHGSQILNNNMNGCTNAILFNKSGDQSNLASLVEGNGNIDDTVFGNLVYNCLETGITVNHNIGKSGYAKWYGVSGGDIEVTQDVKTSDWGEYTLTIESSANPSLWTKRWRAGDLYVNTLDSSTLATTPDDGTPWGEVNFIGSVVSPSFSTDKMKNSGLYTASNFGLFNEFYSIYSNTIDNCENGLIVESLPSEDYTNHFSLKNNVVTNCSGSCLVTNSYKPDTIEFIANSIDDKSAFNFSSDIVYFSGFTYNDESHEDYRPSLSSMVNRPAEDMNYDENYAPIMGGEYNSTPYNMLVPDDSWTLGAINYEYAIYGNILATSIGTNATDLNGTTVNTISISKGILTFAESPQYLSNIGQGDLITYGGGNQCFLIEKGDELTWRVSHGGGGQPSDEIDTVLNSITRVSNSIDTFQSDVESIFGTRDLTANDLKVICAMHDDSDLEATSTIDITGWTTTIDYNLELRTVWDEGRQTNNTGRGLVLYGDVTGNLINIDNEFITLRGVRIRNDNQTSATVNITGSSDSSFILNNIISGGNSGIKGAIPTNPYFVSHNIVYGSEVGIDMDGGEAQSCTVLSELSSYAVGAIPLTNCIGESASGVAFSGTPVMTNCISNDTSAITGTDCIGSVTLNYADRVDEDYRLARADWQAINSGLEYSLSDEVITGGYYQSIFYNKDIDFNNEIEEFSIGADSINSIDTVDLYVSVSKDDTNLLSGGGSVRVFISDSTITFSSTDGIRVIESGSGIGDLVEGDMGVDLILTEKLSSGEWVVRDKFGVPFSGSGLFNITSVSHQYQEIADAVSGLSSLLGDGTNLFTNISAAKYRVNFVVYKPSQENIDASQENFVLPVDVTGYTTGPDNNIRIYTANDMGSEANENNGHYGEIAGSTNKKRKATLEVDSSGSNAISISCPYTEVSGLVIKGGPSSRINVNAVEILSGGCTVRDCIMYYFKHGVNSTVGGDNIINNVIYYILGSGIVSPGGDFIANNTVHQYGSYGYDNTASDRLVNNISQVYLSAVYQGFKDNTTISNCTSLDGSAGGSSGCTSNTEVLFDNVIDGSAVNIDDRSYRLSSLDTGARGNGLALNGNDNYKFSYDNSNLVKRGVIWDRGAIAYSCNSATFSISDYYTDVSPISFTIETIGSTSIATFSEKISDSNIFAGFTAVDSQGISMNLVRKLSKYQWTVSDEKDGAPIPDGTSGSVDLFLSQIGSFSAGLIDGLLASGVFIGTKDLVARNTRVELNIGNTITSLSSNTITGWNCDVSHNITVTSPRDTEYNCNDSQSHSGVMPGNIVDSFCSTPIFGVLDTDYFSATNLSIKAVSTSACNAISVTGNNPNVESCIIETVGTNNTIDIEAPSLPTTGSRVANNILYGAFGDAINVTDVNLSGDGHHYIDNNTVVDSGRGIVAEKMAGPSSAEFFVRNNIVKNTVSKGFVCDNHLTNGKFNLISNTSSDITSDTFIGGLYNISNYNIVFSDEQGFNFFPSPDGGNKAIGSGYDISSSEKSPITYDAAGVERDIDGWTIGALEYVDINGSGSISIESFFLTSDAVGVITDANFYEDIYIIRDINDKISTVNPNVQFESIADANAYIASTTIVGNLRVYVQTGERFSGSFVFGDMSDRIVSIETLPSERHLGPAVIEYDDSLVHEDDIIDTLILTGVKLYSDSLYTGDVIATLADVSNVYVYNSILLINNDCIINHDTSVYVYNSILVYSNLNTDTTVYTAKGSVASIVKTYNTMVTLYSDTDISYEPSDNSVTYSIDSVLSYNYGAGEFNIVYAGAANLYEDINPEFEEAILPNSSFDQSLVVGYNFIPVFESEAVDGGNNAYVVSSVDIIGNQRVYLNNTVDVGPYELKVHEMVIGSDTIREVYQDKLIVKHDSSELRHASRPTSFLDVYHTFNSGAEADEFTRQSNVMISLTTIAGDKTPITDKESIVVEKFDAKFDVGTYTIIVSKEDSEDGDIWKDLYKDGRYYMKLDEKKGILTVYLNDTYDKGLSGKPSILNTVRFGGKSIARF